MSAAPSSELLARLFGSEETTALFGDRARLQGMRWRGHRRGWG